MVTDTYIFIHIPKTAGRSVINAIGGKINNQHKTIADHCNELTEPLVRSRFKFTCVRNPWERAISWWSFFGNMGLERIPFDKWLKKIGSRKRMVGQRFPLDQMSFCRTTSCEILIDYFIRFEKLEEDFVFVAARLGVDSKLPHVGRHDRQQQKQMRDAMIRSKRPELAPLIATDDYREMYTSQELIDIVARLDAETINRFGYSFP